MHARRQYGASCLFDRVRETDRHWSRGIGEMAEWGNWFNEKEKKVVLPEKG